VVTLQRQQRLPLALAAAVCVPCWLYSLRAAQGMHHGDGLLALFVMWAVMMAGMMIPPELPNVLQVARGTRDAALFLSGSLAPWVLFSFCAAALQSRLTAAGLLDHEMALLHPLAAALLLGLAGFLQLSPLKRACLLRCRNLPAAAGTAALASGLRSGLVSVGSCGVLMLVLFVSGVMSLPAMILLTLLLVLERLLPLGWRLSDAAGVLLFACAAARLWA
jgi:predicted metal-binding membrane protein